VLAEAVNQSIEELKTKHGEEAWAAIQTCARASKPTEPSG
jgi:hypothetical protein